MSWSDYLDAVMAKLVSVVGDDGAVGHSRVQKSLPILRAADPVTLLTQFTPGIISAVTRFQQVFHTILMGDAEFDHNRVPASAYVNEDGTKTDWSFEDVGNINAGKDGASITVAQYVAATCDPSSLHKWQRYVTAQLFTYEPVRDSSTDQEGGGGPTTFIRQLMVDYQACIEAAAQIVANDGGNNAQLDGATVEGFYMLLGKLAVDLDTLDESSPDTSSFAEAYSHAKDKTEAALKDVAKNAGEAAGWVANQAGSVAGQFASGFFNQATLLTLAIGAIAVFVLLR